MSGAGPLLRREGTDPQGRGWLVRPAAERDATGLLAVRDAVAAAGGLVAAAPGERTRIEEALALAGILSSGGLALVCESAGEITGSLQVARRRGPYEGHVGDLSIALLAPFRGVGIGSAMLAMAVEWARAVRLRKVCLAVFPDNARAISVYLRAGFAQEGLQRCQVHAGGTDRDLLLMGLVVGD
ncbi:MAG TPA: GNAT family N-acetyltransferase [Candidatus Dormibacteraeota bacterium]|nr:GNAT family N-acetyltransferase [Candidatus Dormibacteraeota bacterium]